MLRHGIARGEAVPALGQAGDRLVGVSTSCLERRSASTSGMQPVTPNVVYAGTTMQCMLVEACCFVAPSLLHGIDRSPDDGIGVLLLDIFIQPNTYILSYTNWPAYMMICLVTEGACIP